LQDETFPDIGSRNDQQLEQLILGGEVRRLSEILAGRGEPPTKPPT
jgi:hypothetical protein